MGLSKLLPRMLETARGVVSIATHPGKLATDVISMATHPRELAQDVVELSTRVKAKAQAKLGKLKQMKGRVIVGLDKATVQRLEQLPVKEFAEESRDIIGKSLGIAPEICPNIYPNDLGKKVGMVFHLSSYAMHMNTTQLNKHRAWLFSGLNHEMQHVRQCLSVIRTEGLGEQAIEKYAKMYTQVLIDDFIAKFKTKPESEILKLIEAGNLPENALQAIKKFHEASKLGDKGIEKFKTEQFAKDFPINYEEWKKLRTKVIDTMGTIKPDSKEALTAKKYHEGFLRTVGKTGGLDYLSSRHELEAYGATVIGYYEYLLRKFI